MYGKLKYIDRNGYKYKFTTEHSGLTLGVASGASHSAVSLLSPSGTETTLATNLYDEQGRLTSTVYEDNNDVRGNYTKYSYDVVGRMIGKSTMDDDYEYIYNTGGELSSVTKNGGEQREVFTYDDAGRLIASRFRNYLDSSTTRNSYTYNNLNQVISVIAKAKGANTDVVKTDYTYTASGKVSTQKTYSDQDGLTELVPSMSYFYDPVGLYSTTSRGRLESGHDWWHDFNTNVAYTDNPSGQTTSLVSSYINSFTFGNFWTGEEYDSNVRFDYEYDDLGNIQRITDYNGKTVDYTYDALGQLKTATLSYWGDYEYYDEVNETFRSDYGFIQEIESFNYDCYGNITSRTVRTVYDEVYSSTDTYQYSYDTNTWSDALSTVTENGTTIRSFSGSLVTPSSNGVFNFTWDGRLLKTARKISDNTFIEFEYNSSDQPVKKVVTKPTGEIETTTYYYSGDTLIQQYVLLYDPSYDYVVMHVKLQYVYDNQGIAYVRVTSLATSDYNFGVPEVVRNAQGDVVMLVGENAGSDSIATTEYSYSAYGEIVSETGSIDINEVFPFRYRGYYYDDDLGMYFLKSRYYDPVVGRFLNADAYVSTGQGIVGYNMFAYCNNNPVVHADATGRMLERTAGCGGGGGYMSRETAEAIRRVIAVSATATAIGVAADSLSTDAIRAEKFAIRSSTKAKEKDAVIPNVDTNVESERQVVFPANPHNFNPVGLIKVEKEGTYNGGFVWWMDPIANTEVFRWDENCNRSNGPHYHIYSTGHYKAGDIVPEPYATIYFPAK